MPAHMSRRSPADRTDAVTSTKTFSRQDERHDHHPLKTKRRSGLQNHRKHRDMEDNFTTTKKKQNTHTHTHKRHKNTDAHAYTPRKLKQWRLLGDNAKNVNSTKQLAAALSRRQ